MCPKRGFFMKKVLLYILVSLNIAICFSSCNKNGSGSEKPDLPMSLEDAIEYTKDIWDKFDIVIAWTDIVPANTQIKILPDITGKDYVVSPDYDAWLIFADTNPGANGGPHYRWIFVGVKNGKIEMLDTTSQPFTFEYSEEWLNHRLEIKRVLYSSATKSSLFDCHPQRTSSSTSNNCWAVIISGGVDMYNNYERYWNDCSWIYKTLRQTYGYPKNHIIPLISDGTDPDFSEVWVSFYNPLNEITTIVSGVYQ